MAHMSGRVAIVTGASRGIGAAIARRLAADGAVVVGTYVRAEQPAAELARDIEARGGEIEMARADMADPAAIRSLFAQTIDSFGRLDILVNNAGLAEFRPLDRVDAGHYGAIFDVNVRGPLLAMQEAARVMASPGRIVNISSGAAQAAPPGASVYAASKAALDALTRSLAAELGARDITVNAVSPGITQTDMLDANIPLSVQEQMVKTTALGRVGTPEDIADVVAFLLSEDARWITGQIIGANGGLR
ncbi:MAG TPA: 3-oxoacyl-ACP reductase family protein [Chthonomonadaceae bacterium]|nr:3-oxoacyl-ACP reductase family protein [Chthonomonadaceae bacterium]